MHIKKRFRTDFDSGHGGVESTPPGLAKSERVNKEKLI